MAHAGHKPHGTHHGHGMTKHPRDHKGSHLPHMGKVHKAQSKGLIATPITKVAAKAPHK